jgi:hypothetical protein
MPIAFGRSFPPGRFSSNYVNGCASPKNSASSAIVGQPRARAAFALFSRTSRTRRDRSAERLLDLVVFVLTPAMAVRLRKARLAELLKQGRIRRLDPAAIMKAVRPPPLPIPKEVWEVGAGLAGNGEVGP